MMATAGDLGIGRAWRRGASFLGTVALSVLATVLIQQGLMPPQVKAQAAQAQEVRASAFVVVGQDGTVLARLAPGATGKGSLNLYDTAGVRRLLVSGDGALHSFDFDGVTPRLEAGYNPTPAMPGAAALNGVLLGPGATVGQYPPSP